ncbi:MAG: leucine-rich repeat protein [Oscillospiraceae bacterium]|nr:leucine-rich repeat protein [Oscillospiraceae bacterium]
MKKLLSLLLCLILLFGLLPMTAPARADSSGDWNYEIDGGEATITKYNGAGGEVTIPSTLGGKPVTVIGNYAFSGCTDLTAVTIPKSITKMEYGAFSGCDGLEQVKISDLKAWCAIEFLDYSANPLYYSHVLYLNGKAVTKLTIPSEVTSISDYAFYGCSTLKSAVIPEGVESIGNRAFSDCSGLTNVTIPSTVTSIGTGAFYGCKSLSSAAIPSGVTAIGDYAFYNCSGLTSVTIPEGVTAIGDYAFCNCSNLSGVVIPEGVTGISNDAFSGCYRLTSVTIPKSVTAIGDYAFYGCSELTSIKIPSGVKNIGDGAFGECGLTSVTIPKSVKAIGSHVFQSMEGYLITAGPTGSGCDIRYGWTASIPKNAFSGCFYLRTAVIPATVTEIRENAFANCSDLQYVHFGGTAEQWEEVILFGGNEALKRATLFFNYQTGDPIIIDSGSCGANLTWTLDNNGKLTISGTGQMYDTSISTNQTIRSVVISNGVTSIGDCAFQDCTGLTSVTIPDSVTSIGDYAFYDCTGLTSVTIPDGIKYINRSAFAQCSSLKSVTIPKSVVEFNDYAFSGCGNLTDIYYGGTQAEWAEILFYYYPPSNVVIHFSEPLSVTRVKANKTVTAPGTAITWTATASGGTLPRQYAFRVYKDGVIVQKGVYSGEKTFTYTPTEVGTYKVKVFVKDCEGTIVSKTSAGVTVTTPPVIAAQPAAATVAVDETATFKVTATGAGLSYQWQYSKDGGTSWYNKTGATEASYSVTAKISYSGMLYRCQVSSGAGSVTSDPAKLTVLRKPAVTTQPSDKTVAEGGIATFKVVASGSGLSYQWQYSKDGGTTWYNKSGATEKSCTVTAKTSYDGFLYRCRVKNAVGTVYSNSAKLTVLPKPVITTQPASKTVAAGETATFKVVASGTGLSYQWQYSKDGGTTWYNKTDANSTTYTVTAKASYDGFLYRCKVKNSAGAVYSNTAKLTVADSTAPVISSIKANKTGANTGETITWTAAASGGTGTLKYYFILYKDGTKIATQAYSTAKSFSYTPAEAGTYKVRVYVKDADGTKANKLSSGVTVSVPNPGQQQSSIKLTNGNPSGAAKTISFTTRNELTGGKTGNVRDYTAQPLDNGYTRFSLSYSIPEQMNISIFNPPEGTLFKLLGTTENAGNSGNLIFDLKNKDLNAIDEVSIKFYQSDSEAFWVFFYTDQLK